MYWCTLFLQDDFGDFESQSAEDDFGDFSSKTEQISTNMSSQVRICYSQAFL